MLRRKVPSSIRSQIRSVYFEECNRVFEDECLIKFLEEALCVEDSPPVSSVSFSRFHGLQAFLQGQ